MGKIIKPTDWNLAQIWNQVAYKDNRPLQKRNYIYASEVGYPFVDRWLKMKAVPYTNPPNARSLRKFLAGNVWEAVVKMILVACGVFRHEEVKADATPYKGMLDVHGRLDFIAGGHINREQALLKVYELQLPDFLVAIAERIINELSGGTLVEKILELKAVSTFAMDLVERRRSAIPNHTLQAFHYQKHTRYLAEVAYICKDDCRMAQFKIDAKQTEPLYKADIEQMTLYYANKTKRPPLSPLALFDFTTAKFSKNLGVEYSPYLTMLYGFKSPEEYRDSVSFVLRWNRALDRFAQVEIGGLTPSGKPITITTKNMEVKAEIIKAGYKFDDLLAAKKEVGVQDTEEE